MVNFVVEITNKKCTMENVLRNSSVKTLLSMCMLFVCCFLSFASTADEKKNIPLQGQWEEGKRSISINYSVSVSWDGTCLYVESLSPRSTIHVALSNGVENVCDETIQAGSCPATLYIGALDPGEAYQLVLTNQFGDRLEGTID